MSHPVLPLVEVTPEVLAGMRPPQPGDSAHKGIRGTVLIVGGAAHTPGAALLAGIAALRSGAGVVQMAVAESVSRELAVALPEARVVGMPESARGDIAGVGAARIAELAAGADAVLIGPGLSDDEALAELVPALLGSIDATALVIDAHALHATTADALSRHRDTAVLTPNTKEAADLLGLSPEEVEGDPGEALASLLERFACSVALRGGETLVARPGDAVYHDRTGTPGLGTSGSGDVLVGFLAGLAARGLPPHHAAVWASHVHGVCGERLSARIGRLGFLARELLDQLPIVATELGC